MGGRTGLLPGWGHDEAAFSARPKRKRIRPARECYDESRPKIGPKGGILRRGDGKGRRYEDLTGLRFGAWTVVEFSHYREDCHCIMWMCECECGTRQIRKARDLNANSYYGCRQCKAGRQIRVAYSSYWYRIKAGAKKRGLVFTIDREATIDLLSQQGYRCALTGLPIQVAVSQRLNRLGETTASLDRINNDLGYITGNVWWVHKEVNRMKGIMDVNRMIELCKFVAATHGDKACQQSVESPLR